MGCSNSKLGDEEVVQLCKDRRRFIKQTVEYGIQFAAGHAAYIDALRRVSLALRDYIDGAEDPEFISNSLKTPLSAPIKKTIPELIGVPLKSLSVTPDQSHICLSCTVNCLRSGGTSSVTVIERPQSPETMRIESYPPVHHFGIDGFFVAQSPPLKNSSFFSSPYHKEIFSSPSPIQTSQLDFFWDPFSSLDAYAYSSRNSIDGTAVDDEIIKPKVPEEKKEKEIKEAEMKEDGANDCSDCAKKEGSAANIGTANEATTEVSQVQNVVEAEVGNKEAVAAGNGGGAAEETPDFTAYASRRPTSMAEVVKELETQFTEMCNCAREVTMMLEASVPQSSTVTEQRAIKLLNPIALFRSVPSHSTSTYFGSLGSGDNCYDGSGNISEESWLLSKNLRSTLERLYEWEKRLYEEVKSGVSIRRAYEKKCLQLINQGGKGEDSSPDDKTRAAIRDLHARMKVSMQTVRTVSMRIEELREELQPLLMELIQGLSRMWRVMAECHLTQKRALDEAKILLTDTPPKLSDVAGVPEPDWLARFAANLESVLRNWRTCFESWIASQQSYTRSLAGWALRCVRSDTGMPKFPFSPRQCKGEPPILEICIQWSRFVEEVPEAGVIEGLDFLAAGVRSVYGRDEEEAKRGKRFGVSANTGGRMELMAAKTEEVAVRALCAGMSAAVSSLTDFAVRSAEGYEELMKHREKDTSQKVQK